MSTNRPSDTQPSINPTLNQPCQPRPRVALGAPADGRGGSQGDPYARTNEPLFGVAASTIEDNLDVDNMQYFSREYNWVVDKRAAGTCFVASAVCTVCASCHTRKHLGEFTSASLCFPMHCVIALVTALVGFVPDLACCVYRGGERIIARDCNCRDHPCLTSRLIVASIDTNRGWHAGVVA
eukprot:m.137179 g.137179  ORF g.137179 m.137179 type:complete len:181 (-) comp16989_c0_seq4:12-554(-)